MYKDKIINASDIDDARSNLDIAILLTADKTEMKLLNSLISDNRYNKKMETNKLIVYLNILSMLTQYNDAETLINDLQKNVTDIVQLNTFKRLLRNKSNNYNKNNNAKHCPHCNQLNFNETNTSYIICGYSNRGYDWKGCGRDWCFACGKKLCKSWNHNLLFNKLNRHHDSKCCKNNAHNNGEDYENKYCMCKNDYVSR
jgi:hypothetical protein